MGDCFIGDIVVDDLKHAPMARGIIDGLNNRVLIRVAEIDDRNGEGLALDGGNARLLGLLADELGGEGAGGEHGGSDVLDLLELHGCRWVWESGGGGFVEGCREVEETWAVVDRSM